MQIISYKKHSQIYRSAGDFKGGNEMKLKFSFDSSAHV